jgi:hypothetical protein
VFVIARDARGSLVHVRRRDDGECVGCIEVGLYQIVRGLILAAEVEAEKRGGGDRRSWGGVDMSATAAPRNRTTRLAVVCCEDMRIDRNDSLR